MKSKKKVLDVLNGSLLSNNARGDHSFFNFSKGVFRKVWETQIQTNIITDISSKFFNENKILKSLLKKGKSNRLKLIGQKLLLYRTGKQKF